MGPSQRIDSADVDQARALLRTCCGSSAWVERMIALRPFRKDETLYEAARREWFTLGPKDWKEAFGEHPRIGDRENLRMRFPVTHHLSASEQAGAHAASEDVLDALAAGNSNYEQRFGYIFIVCATGKSANEMLDLLQARLLNDPAHELRVAASEQARITELRLRKLGERGTV
jgi:2-oxo-4-hydroxy-4-carboxy-5-ureidoimidazoline decarboxylase